MNECHNTEKGIELSWSFIMTDTIILMWLLKEYINKIKSDCRGAVEMPASVCIISPENLGLRHSSETNITVSADLRWHCSILSCCVPVKSVFLHKLYYSEVILIWASAVGNFSSYNWSAMTRYCLDPQKKQIPNQCSVNISRSTQNLHN